MTEPTGILLPACTQSGVRAPNRKRALQFASDLLAQNHPEISARELFDNLTERERLGSTGLGEGVAIPHCRLEGAPMMAALLCLAEPIDYDAPDGQGVDLFYVLVVPPEETTAHLEVLGRLAEVFSDAGTCSELRGAANDAHLHELFSAAIARAIAQAGGAGAAGAG